MQTARAQTKARRTAIEKRRVPTLGERYDALPLNTRVAYAICGSFYNDCACKKSLDKPVCVRLEGAARYVIDMVRRHDHKAKGSP